MLTGELSTTVNLRGEIYRGIGTTDYNELENKPTYNGHIIEGNLTSDSLGIWQPKNFSTNEQNTGLKWIDGKDIYLKCYQTTISNADNTYIDNTFNNSLIHVLPMSSISIDTKGNYNTTFVFNVYDGCILRIICNYVGVAINCENYNTTKFGTATVYVVLYYTKIID